MRATVILPLSYFILFLFALPPPDSRLPFFLIDAPSPRDLRLPLAASASGAQRHRNHAHGRWLPEIAGNRNKVNPPTFPAAVQYRWRFQEAQPRQQAQRRWRLRTVRECQAR